MPKYELSLEVLHEASRKTFSSVYDAEQECYQLLSEVLRPRNMKATTALSSNLVAIDTIDRAIYLRAVRHQQKLSEMLCKKYGISMEGQDENE